MQLTGFAFSNYRSYGDDLIKIAPLKKINLIIGKNNSGKSNIINFLANQYNFFSILAAGKNLSKNSEDYTFQDIDEHTSDIKMSHYRIGFALSKQEVENYLIEKITNFSDSNIKIPLFKILDSFYLDQDDNLYWFIYESQYLQGGFSPSVSIDLVSSILTIREWDNLWQLTTRKSGGGLKEHWIPEILNILSYVPKENLKVEVIPAIRKIGIAGTTANDFSGEGIIERLALLQNPSRTEQELKNKFKLINNFLQTVLNNDTAIIEIPYQRDMILVHMDGKTLPLDSLGTGVHEVVIIAAAATLLEDTIVCMEEPELHLHPLLQKKLIQYLFEMTENQYIFTTHSAHLLDAVELEIFHVIHNNGISTVKGISSTKQKSEICNDLGYKASDLLQSNCIIWVEGPSDRIYLNYWINKYNDSLKEGINYSIMFYGGKLFSHLTALDNDEIKENVDDFISLKNLNRNSIIVFDSDKTGSRAHLSSTKKRLKEEFNKGSGYAWITEGREIENYLNYEILKQCIYKIHPSAYELCEEGQWANLLKYKKKKDKKIKTASKVKVAREYINNNEPDFTILNLEKQVRKMCSVIKAFNDT